MKPILQYSGIACAVVATALLAFQYQLNNDLENKIVALKADHERLQQDSQLRITQLNSTIDSLKLRVKTAERMLASADDGTGAGPAARAPANVQRQPVNMLEAANKLMSSPRVMDMMSKLTANSMYGEFIAQLKLGQVQKEAVAKILTDSQAAKLQLAADLRSGKISRDEYARLSKANEQQTQSALADYLAPDDLTALARYEASAPLRAQESQLARLAPALDPAARTYVAKILTEQNTNTSAIPANASSVSEIMAARNLQMDATLQRIRNEGVLDQSQMATVEGYFQQQQNMLKFGAEALSNLSRGNQP